MNVIRLFGVLGVACALGAVPAAAQKKAVPKPPKPQISAATRQKAAEDNANPEALVLVDFQKRVDAYMAIQKAAAKDSLPIKETNNPAEIKVAQQALGAKIRAARADAKPGDILTAEIKNKFRRLMYPVVQGTGGRETKGDREDDRLRQRASRRQGGADTEPNSAAGRGDRLRCEGKNDSEIG